MKAIVFSLGLLVPCFGLAQNTTRFSKSYDYGNFWQGYVAAKEIPNKQYLLAGQNTGYWLSDAFLWVHFLNAEGDTIRDVQIYSGDSSVYYIGRQAILQAPNGDIYNAGGRRYQDDNITIGYLMKMDSVGTFLWENHFGGNSFDNFDVLLMNSKQELVFAGISYSLIDTAWGNVYIVKADTAGEVIWQKSIGVNNYPERCWSMDTTADGGFILAGAQGFGGSNGIDVFVMKTDSAGNLVWKKIFGSNEYNDKFLSRIRTLKNGDFLLTTGLWPAENVAWAYIARLTPSGSIIWQKNYPPPPQSNYSWFDFSTELLDGSLVVNGGLTEFDSLAANWRERATLTKLSSLGQLVWQRKFHMRPDLPSYFWSMTPTSDAGFLMGGIACREGNNRSDAWAVKVDSLGCLEPGCAGSVAAPEPGAAIGLSIRPNPVADWLTVASPEAVLLGLRLTDLSGRVLEDVQFFRQHGLQEYRLSLAALPPGLYVLSVRTEKGWVVEKVVKH